jgi:hypothetical protein
LVLPHHSAIPIVQDVKLKDFAGLLGQCLVPEAIDRLAPEEALQHGFLRRREVVRNGQKLLAEN